MAIEAQVFDRELDCLTDAGGLPVHAWRPGEVAERLAALPAAQGAFVRGAGFKGAAGQLVLLPGEQGVSGALLGLGNERSVYSHGGLAKALPEGTAWTIEPGDFDQADAVLGWCLGAYSYDRLSKPARRPAMLAGAAAHVQALAMARATWFARDLINTPANLLGPSELADAVATLAGRFGAVPMRVEGAALDQGYPAIAAVGAGSDRAPVVAGFAWRGSDAGPGSPLLALCGKGVVFDTGGYDLKPSSAMLRMKKDMGGAALILGLASAVMAADLPLRMEVRIGCAENMVSGRAMRPMDVIGTRKGLTIEIGNTDAEGRLVLCDLLTEVCESEPDLVIDAATLTGAARVALGPDLPAILTNDDAVAEAALAAGIAASDPVWRLPLHAGYDPWLASAVADLGNVSGKPMAGAIVAGLFLQRFVPPLTPWLHIDTYAWNDQTRPGRPEGGEALGIRAFFNMVCGLKRFNLCL